VIFNLQSKKVCTSLSKSIGLELRFKGSGFNKGIILNLFLDRINRIHWIFSFDRSPEESGQTTIACGEGEYTRKFSSN
jgi:hypothetical protein